MVSRFDALVFLLLLFCVLAMQWISGSFTSELANPDEPAHFISGLMVRDYLLSGFSAGPVEYARAYYSHYPKVAIGNWPPLFYGVQGLWMLLLPAQPVSVLLLMALLTATMSWLVFRVLRPALGGGFAAFGAGLLVVLAPMPQYAGLVMLEIPVAVATLLAVGIWARYLEVERLRIAIAFGATAALAVLIKGNALFLALVPPISILLGRRWHLLRRRGLWAAALLVLLVAGPWMWFFLDDVRSGWKDAVPSLDFVLTSLGTYSRSVYRTLGVAGTALLVIGAVTRLRRPETGQRERAIWQAAAALFLAVVLFHLLVPAGIDRRHLIPAYPALAMFVAAGARSVSLWLAGRGVDRSMAGALVIGAFAVAFVTQGFRLPDKRIEGYRAAATFILDRGEPSTSLILSDAVGEGAFIVEVARRDPARPCHAVWRGSSLLSLATWAGRGYRLRAENDGDVLDLLRRASVGFVVVDRAFGRSPHQTQMEALIEANPEWFDLMGEQPLRRGNDLFPSGLAIYRVILDIRSPGGGEGTLRQVPGYDGVEVLSAPAPVRGACRTVAVAVR